MTYQTRTLTRTQTISHSDVRYVISKVVSDMYQLRIYHGVFDEQYEEDMALDLLQWVYSGYAERIQILFFMPSTSVIRFEIKYEINRAGVITFDEDAGSIPFVNLSGCRFQILVTTNGTWDNLTNDGKRVFYGRLIRPWSISTIQPIYEGGNWGNDRTYSKNNLAVSRSIYTG